MNTIIRILFICAVLPITGICRTSISNDTTFLLRQGPEYISHIYIAPDTSSEYYAKICEFGLPGIHPNESKSQFPMGNWLPLYSYNQQYYLYYPCDFGTNVRYKISGKMITEYGFEETHFKATKINKVNDDTYNFKFINPATDKEVNWVLHLIDPKKGIAVLETGPKDARNYRLFVSTTMMKQYPMIIHECSAKADEFEFEDINFKTLLEMKKSNRGSKNKTSQ